MKMSIRAWGALLALPLSAWAGAYDYFECTGADGEVSYSVTRCPKGASQRRIADTVAPGEGGSGAASYGNIRLTSGPGGHFFATGRINGVPLRLVVDTGATHVSLSASAARRLGLNTAKGKTVTANTANGATQAVALTLDSVELQGQTVRGVSAMVMSQDLGPATDVLLGMSFLRHFEVNSDGYIMTLRPK